MQTQLGTYCQQFDGTMQPMLRDVERGLEALAAAADATPGKALHAPLLEFRHQLRALCDKVEQQQAYVLIFGPLKSGKSTLMNAIAASYVSEVSSLPAYPCLVFVRAGERREYVVTSYDGGTRRFDDAKRLHDDIADAHTELAEAIRTAEQRGETFDPQEHYPAAIRRVDVHVPDSKLERSGAVLVDTPGLYTRMRFGYDRMTREFRDAAACAIFVVKSDTLFLEQVFTEFQQLLELFSRIFLVVNVDSQKRDVGPDGSLVPSLEQSEPEVVLKAFEQLAMSAPLQQAKREGRVRMYPVDLLHAASHALSKGTNDRAPTPREPKDGFRHFETDLNDYLASSEYLSAFLRDSLQRAETLLRELGTHLDGDDVRVLERQLREVDDEREWHATEQRRVEQALQLDWTEAFARSRRDVAAEVERSARDHGAKLLRTLGASIDTWFLSSQSLRWLVQGQWTPLVRDYRESVLQAGRRALAQATAQPHAGLDLPQGIAELADRAGIDLPELREQALAAIGNVAWPKHAVVPVDPRRIPIRKAMLDRLAFRSLDKVRERLFGPADAPDSKLPGKDKARHLGEPGRLHLHQCVAKFRAELLPQTTSCLGEHFGTRLIEAAAAQLQGQLAAYAPRLQQRREQLDRERARLLAVAEPLRALRSRGEETLPKLDALEAQFVRETQKADAKQADHAVLQPAPARSRSDQGQRRRGKRTEPVRSQDRTR